MVHKLPESEGDARVRGRCLRTRVVYGHKSLATVVYLLYYQADWFNGFVATTNKVTEIVNSQSKHCIL